MKKYIIWVIILIITGNIIRLVVEHQEMSLAQPLVWLLGTIGFVLFAIYELVPLVVNWLEERRGTRYDQSH
ncbi:hypothetical protein [Streptococcus ovuberis]|uniref:Uncharacterized protein n=1 Tax=Streptococcus ovuberis TaxID=1936207 RepID=A0A7X6MWF6_9STRE|nr:hypothetical protein [Streptococcus ovuberis]NKZ19645.1 hypothetical protein [Streptococcus ovuberis]